VLLETTTDGAVARLEVSSAAGLLTLHPDGATLHGNVVRPLGIDHVTLPWPADTVLLVAGSPVTAAAAARVLARRVGVGEGRSVAVVEVDGELRVRAATYRVARVAPDRWLMLPAAGEHGPALELDADWAPVLAGAATWPLESEDAAGPIGS
jgi:hypothetical protein